MKKKYFLNGFIVILMISNLVVLFSYFSLIDKTNVSFAKLHIENNQLKRIIDNKDKIEIAELINNDNTDSILIHDLTLDNSTFVYRFFSGGCHSCTDSILTLLNKLPPKIKAKLLIVADYNTGSELNAILKFNGINEINFKNTYQLNFPFDIQKIPYFFIVDNHLIRMFFIPDKENKTRTLNYLNHVIDKYLE